MKYVNVEVIDPTGNSYAGRYDFPAVTFTDTNTTTLTFTSAVSGYASVVSGGGISGFSGTLGVSGYSGTSGRSGYSGIGTSGYSGASGIGTSGYSGVSGASTSGYSGASGVGTSGYSGVSGYSGTSGIPGPATAINATAQTSGTYYVVGVTSGGSNQTPSISTTAPISFDAAAGSLSTILINSVGTGISAAGSTQGTATALTKTVNILSTVGAGTGVVLPTAVAGRLIYIVNTGVNAVQVYPATGAAINALASNANLTQSAGGALQYIASSATQWYTIGATYA